MEINIEDNSWEIHYKFFVLQKNINTSVKSQYEFIFMYAHGLPTLICDVYKIHYIFWFSSHQLYLDSIKYMMDNYKYSLMVDVKKDKKYDSISFVFDDRRRKLSTYKKQSYEVQELIQEFRKMCDIKIDSIHDFKQILCYAPSLGSQNCELCNEWAAYYDLYVDTNWNYDNNKNKEYKYSIVCEKCYCSFNTTQKLNYQKYSNELNNSDIVCNALNRYSYAYSHFFLS